MSSASNAGRVRQFATNTRWAMLAKLVSAGVSIPLFILLPRFLGTEGYGQFALAVSVLVVLRLLSGGGLGYAAGRRLAEGAGKGEGAGSILAAGLSLQLVLAVSLGLLFVVVAGPISAVFGGADRADSTLATLFQVVGIAVVFFSLTEFSKAAFQGLQLFQYLALVTIIEFIGKLVLAAGLAWSGYGVVAVFGGFAVALTLAGGTGLFLLSRVGVSAPSAPRRWALWKDLYLYNVPLMVTTAGFIVYTELDTMMLGYYSGFTETGIYAAAKNIARAAPLFAVPFGQAAAPLFVRMIKDDGALAADFLDRLFRYVGAVFIPAAAAVAVTAPFLVGVLGPGYSEAVLPLRVMSIFLVSISFGVVVSPILDFLGEAPRRARWMMMSVAANIGLNLVLIPRYGAVGAALATVLTHGPFVFNNLRFLSDKVGLERRRLAASLLPIVAISALAAGAAVLALSLRNHFLVGLGAGMVVYLGLIFALGVVSRSELADVLKLVTGQSSSDGLSD